MALKNCPSCGKQVRDVDPYCWNCGAAMTPGQKPPNPSAQNGCAGCAMVLIVIAVVGWCASSGGGGRPSSGRSVYDSPAPSAEDSEKKRAADSVMVFRVEAEESPASWDVEIADGYAHEHGWTHDRTHSRAVRLLLSRADSILRAGGEMSHVDAANVLGKVQAPLTDAQTERLAGLQRRQEAAAKRATATAERDARRAYAQRLETGFLDGGLDIEVTTSGERATTLRLKYVLFTRVWVHKVQNDTDLISNARRLGFRRVIMTDGYEDTWTWDLTK